MIFESISIIGFAILIDLIFGEIQKIVITQQLGWGH